MLTRTRLTASLLTVPMIACGALTADAATNVTRNGVSWANTFEGDVASLTVSSPAWTVFDNNGFATESTDGDIYSYQSGSTGTTVSYTAPNWAGTGTARTAEIRARVPNATNQAGDGVGSFITSNGSAYDLRFFVDRLAFNNNGDLASETVAVDMTEFHIIRAVVDTTATFAYTLYLDNNPTPVLQSNNFWFGGFDDFVVGDISAGGESGNLDIDYISWTPGAFAPVPEPGSLALLGLAGLTLLRRRRLA